MSNRRVMAMMVFHHVYSEFCTLLGVLEYFLLIYGQTTDRQMNLLVATSKLPVVYLDYR
jgi:hypothetical protein